jgi:hypothetical protein
VQDVVGVQNVKSLKHLFHVALDLFGLEETVDGGIHQTSKIVIHVFEYQVYASFILICWICNRKRGGEGKTNQHVFLNPSFGSRVTRAPNRPTDTVAHSRQKWSARGGKAIRERLMMCV